MDTGHPVSWSIYNSEILFLLYRCDNPVAVSGGQQPKKIKLDDEEEDIDDVTREFRDQSLLSGRSRIFA